MIYVFPSSTGECSIVYDETSLTKKNKAEGIAIENLPVANTPADKIPILMGDKANNTVWWDYVDKPQVKEDVTIATLQSEINSLSDMLIELTTNN